MTRKEFVDLKIGDHISFIHSGPDLGRECLVVGIYPMEQEKRKIANSPVVTGQTVDGSAFLTGIQDTYNKKKANINAWRSLKGVCK